MDWIARLNRDATGRVPVLVGATVASVEVLHWAYVPALVDNVPHRHTFYEVCLVGGHGRGVFTVGGVAYAIAPGDLFLARPGVLHQIRNTGDRLMELAWVSLAVLPGDKKSIAAFERFAASGDIVVVPESVHALGTLWYGAVRTVAERETGGAETVRAVVGALLAGIMYAGSDARESAAGDTQTIRGDNRVARLAVRYIHDNLNRAIGIPEIAAQVHVSPRHLTRLIEAFTGVPPARYIERARLDRAATLLSRTQTPIKQIAEAVGYAGVHPFARAFARVHGIAPGAFRQSGDRPIRRDADTEPQGSLV